MSLFLILFFFSLLAISLLIGRRIILNNQELSIEKEYEYMFNVPDLEETGSKINKITRKYSYHFLVLILRLHLLSLNFLKKKYKLLKEKIRKNHNLPIDISKENKFLKMINEYKIKIRKIKKQIKIEEGLN